MPNSVRTRAVPPSAYRQHYGHNSYLHSINVDGGITKGPCKDLEKRLQ